MIHWTDTIPADWPRALRWPGRILVNLTGYAGILATWQDRADGRRQLLALDDRMLRDIGISRADAMKEAGKPFWRK